MPKNVLNENIDKYMQLKRYNVSEINTNDQQNQSSVE